VAEVLDELRAIAAGTEQARTEEVAALLERLLRGEWEAQTQQGLRSVVETIESGSGPVSPDVIEQAVGQMRPFLRSRLRSAVRDGVVQAVDAAYAIGEENISARAAASINAKDRRLQNFLGDNATFWIGNHYDQEVQGRLRAAAKRVFENEGGALGRRKAAQEFQNTFSVQFQKSQSYWELLANDVTTKSREFGRVEGMVQAGIEEYRIDAILDRRTSDVCRHLDGKLFKVADAVAHRERLVESGDPKAIKEISPWPEADSIRALSAEELAERGVLLPPFHGHCRTRIQAVQP
jgi:SPP1 gp7 family putative phage head morphogenesis protein